MQHRKSFHTFLLVFITCLIPTSVMAAKGGNSAGNSEMESRVSALEEQLFTPMIIDVSPPYPTVVERAKLSPAPYIPGWKLTCLDSTTGATCKVVRYGGHTFWALSRNDNTGGFMIVAFSESLQAAVSKLSIGGSDRYIKNITLDDQAQMVTFIGQYDRSTTMPYSSLLALALVR